MTTQNPVDAGIERVLANVRHAEAHRTSPRYPDIFEDDAVDSLERRVRHLQYKVAALVRDLEILGLHIDRLERFAGRVENGDFAPPAVPLSDREYLDDDSPF